MRARRGVTLPEIMIVLVIMGIGSLVAYPRLARTMSIVSVRSAKQQVASSLVLARAAAVHNGRATMFIRQGNTIRVTIDSAGTQVNLGNPQDLGSSHRVTLSTWSSAGTARDTIRFDPRGIAAGGVAIAGILIQRDAARDSVCIVGLGRVSTKGCSL